MYSYWCALCVRRLLCAYACHRHKAELGISFCRLDVCDRQRLAMWNVCFLFSSNNLGMTATLMCFLVDERDAASAALNATPGLSTATTSTKILASLIRFLGHHWETMRGKGNKTNRCSPMVGAFDRLGASPSNLISVCFPSSSQFDWILHMKRGENLEQKCVDKRKSLMTVRKWKKIEEKYQTLGRWVCASHFCFGDTTTILDALTFFSLVACDSGDSRWRNQQNSQEKRKENRVYSSDFSRIPNASI